MSALHEALLRHAATNPAGIALDPAVGPSLTWAELARRVATRAAMLRSGAARGEILVLDGDHGVETVVAELAAIEAGLPVLSLPRFFTPDQAAHARAATLSPSDGNRTPSRPASSGLPPGTARVTFTSGSTGTPRGLCLSAEHMLTVAGAIVDALGAGTAGRHCALLPPGILLETVAGLFPTVLAGGTYVCPPQAELGLADPFRPDFAAMLRRIATLGITSLILVPEYLAGLVAAMNASGQRLPALTLVAVGGARVSPELLAAARALGLPVRQGYGLTECGSVVSLETGDETLPGSAGRVLPHLSARIADDGEIVLDGPMYLGAPGEPRKPGPLHTGDIGRIDAQGRLWIEGRKSAMIVTSFGRNIAPEWIEAALAAQPQIAQAMVFGDGEPAPRALLVAAHPEADLATAVAAANATLPGYARLRSWREVAPFTPDNAMLTGNGRLRRKAIAATWLADPVPFFAELEAATWRARLRFLAVPQVRAGLSGTITRRAYTDYLTQAYHHVRHTVPLMQAARAALTGRHDADAQAMIAALEDYILEETGHEEWILADIAAAGADADAARHSAPHPATRAMIEHAYARIEDGAPAAFFGMVYVLESVSVALAQRGASAVAANLGLPPEAFTYLISHGALDQDHMAFFAALVNRIDSAADRAAILAMAQDMFALFAGVFAAIELEDARVAA